MKKLLFILAGLLVAICGYSQVYFDGSNSIPQTLTSGTSYYFQKGKTFTISNTISGSNVSISSYGSGNNPVITFTNTSGGFNLSGKSTINNVNITVSPFNDFAIKAKDNCTIDGLNIIGGDPAIFVDGGTVIIIKNCNISGTYFDAINGLSNIDTLKLTNVNIKEPYYSDETICDLGYTGGNGGGSQDLFHVENAQNVILDKCDFNHSTTRGKFAFICNKYKSIVVSNSVFVGFDGGAVTFIGGSTGSATFLNCWFVGGDMANSNNGNVIYTNCIFKGHKTFGISEGGNRTAIGCTFINVGNNPLPGKNPSCISGWNYTTSVSNCLFVNCKNVYSTNTLQGNDHNNYWKSGIGSNLVKTVYNIDPKFIDTVYYKTDCGFGANISIPAPVQSKTIITPNWKDSTAILKNELFVLKQSSKACNDSLGIYRNVMYNIVIKGLKNTYQTKASILKQLSVYIKY